VKKSISLTCLISLSTPCPHVHGEYYRTVINTHSAFWWKTFIPKTVKKTITTWFPVKVSEGNAITPLPSHC